MVAVRELHIALVARKRDGGRISREDFLSQIEALPDRDQVVVYKRLNEQVGQTCSLGFFSASVKSSEETEFEVDAMLEASERKLVQIASWITERQELLLQLQESLALSFLFSFWIDLDQFDIDLPPEFLEACGRIKMPIKMLSNE